MRRSSCIPAPRKTLFIAFCVRRTFGKKVGGGDCSGREVLLCRIETEMPEGIETKSPLHVPLPSRASASTVFFKFCC